MQQMMAILTISDVTKGSPAEAAGIQIDDKIIEVDGESIKGLSGADVSAKVKGEVGTDVTLGIYRKSVNDMKTITVTRADIQVHTVAYEMLENDMGYISISNFRENTYQQFEKALETLQTEGMKRIDIGFASKYRWFGTGGTSDW